MRKILIVRFSSLGDIVLITPVIRSLKMTYPQAQISLVTKKEFADLIQFIPQLDQVIIFDPGDGLKGLWRLIKRVRAEEFDLLVDLHANRRSKLLSLLSHAHRRVKYNKLRLRRYLRIYLGVNLLPRRSHIIDFYFKPLRRFSLITYDHSLHLEVNKDIEERAINFLYQAGIKEDDLVIGLCPGSKWPTKRWPAERFAMVGDSLMEMGMKIIIFGSHDEINLCNKVELTMKHNPLNLVGKTSLVELVPLIKQCTVLVTNDSALMHLAAGLDVSVVAMFGPTTLDLGFGPVGQGHIVLRKRFFCRPCSSHGSKRCWLRSHKCMEMIRVDEVMDAVKRLIEHK